MRVWLLAFPLGCKGPAPDTGTGPAGPTLEHEPPEGTFVAGDSVTLSVAASDPDGVAAVRLYHRVDGDEFWETLALGDDGETWSGTVEDLQDPGLAYYFKATDDSEAAAVSYLPEAGPSDPFLLPVAEATTPLPFTEDFEPGDDELSLFSMGWWTPSETAFTGYQFELTDAEAHSDAHSAFHSRGAEGTGELRDWLISPALDFSDLDGVMVTWWERGEATDAMGAHGLYVSTGSRDPADGDFVPVEEDLPAPPEGEWARSDAWDLSDWAGEPKVYVGWRYTGEAADDWAIDDVSVRALAADLDATLAWSPDPVHPGERAKLAVLLRNEAAAPATGLVATLSLPEGGGTLLSDTVDVGDIAAEGSATVPFTLDLDADLHDNRYLPLALSVTDGADTWDFDLAMTVGEPSEATLTITLDETTTVHATLGVGDPDDPTLEFDLASGFYDAGTFDLAADITDAWANLPPAPGDDRWFARVETSGSGTVDAFAITYGGETTTTEGPFSLSAGDEVVVRLPEPPDPQVAALDPASLSPDGVAVPLAVTLVNAGAVTAGPVTATAWTDDPDLALDGPGATTLDPDAWEAGEEHDLTGLTVAVDPGHVDSEPVVLGLTLDDGVETWDLAVELPVPWPVMRVTTVTIDDSGGDGILDPDEEATVSIEIANAGDLDAFGTVRGTLSVESTSTASATVTTTGEQTFGSLASGRRRDADFDLAVTGGAEGDTLDLLLSLSDGTATYEARTQLVLGEPPWQTLASADDAEGDVLDGYGFDFTNARYRVQDGTIELLFDSAVEIDPSTLYLEAWGLSAAADWDLYRWVLQSGTLKLQGYSSSSGFTTLATTSADFPSSTEVLWTWEAADMGLALDTISMGFGAGWCGPPDYFCDAFPDGWGYPYDSWTSADFFTLSW